MKSRLLAFALCALLVPAAVAVQLDQPASKAQPQEARRPLLWKVSDADNAVYLLGSFHLLKADDYPLPVEVDRAFDDSASLLFEIDPAAMSAPDSMAVMQKYMAYEDGKSLSTVLPGPTLEKLSTLVSAGGGSVQALEHSEPWEVSLGLVLGVTRAMGFSPELGLDRKLMARASEAGKPVAGLETVEDQMRAEMARKTPESYRLLDVERNRAWLPQVEKRLSESKKDNTLVVVGSLHLLGSDGLVEQLKAKGYAVERICDSCAVD